MQCLAYSVVEPCGSEITVPGFLSSNYKYFLDMGLPHQFLMILYLVKLAQTLVLIWVQCDYFQRIVHI